MPSNDLAGVDRGPSRDAVCRFAPLTPPNPGAIAIVELTGDVIGILTALTDRTDWPIGRLRLVPFDEVDTGLAGRIDRDLGQIMPHGGPRVIQRLTERLRELGATFAAPPEIPVRTRFPEAADEIEAVMLATLARAASPLSIDLLLDQPRRWREQSGTLDGAEIDRSRRLNRLIDPPLVVVAGPPNVGKSTLSNTLLGRSMSIELDHPGTTRDYTAGLIDLGGLVVRWHDTPGLREAVDAIESRAIDLARRLIERADLLIAITDAEHDWPELPRQQDLRVASKADLEARGDGDLAVSALTGLGLAELSSAVRERLVPLSDPADGGRWLFDERMVENPNGPDR